ncbi:hypothetical protein PIB30_056676 [Stylosanthes scabra]|uniref:Uncharacterized protein n=1 Tax=Stylosanthes scabra TaxID=79078 RepID=A0ABU6YJL4_9FABA|nr:hypothetical protein [Stylosanthes scabra]
MARPRPLFLMRKFFVGGATARPRSHARTTPFRNDQDYDNLAPAQRRWRVHGIDPKIPVAWRRRAPSWRARTARASAQWPWRACALALGALGKGPGRAARPHALDGTLARAHYHAFLGPHCMARPRARHGAPTRWRLHLKSERTPLFSHSHSQFLSSSPILSIPNPSISHTNTLTSSLCVISLAPHRRNDSQKEVNGRKGEGEARHITHLEISAIGGVTSLLATNFSQISAKAKKAIADAVRIYSKAWETPQAPVVEPSKDVKGKKTARVSVKPLRKRFSQRIIAQGGPSRPKPTKNEVIEEKKEPKLEDEEEEEDPEEAAEEKKDPKPKDEEEEEDPEEASACLTLPSPPKGPSGAYDDPHYWDYDGDLDQWGTDVFGGEPAAAQALDSAEGSEGSCSPSSTSAK